MTNNRGKFFILVLIILAAIVIVWFLNYFINYQASEYVTEGEGIIELQELNEEAVSMAQSYKIPTVRGVDDSDLYIGDLNAPIQIIIYEDYSNYYNAQFNETLKQVQNEFKDTVSFTYRPYPVKNQGLASKSAQAVLCAHDQDRFADYRTKVYEKTLDRSLFIGDLGIIAEEIGLDETEFNSCLTAGTYQSKVAGAIIEAKSFSVFGAPTSFINNELIIGARPWEDSFDSNQEKILGLKTIIEKQLQ